MREGKDDIVETGAAGAQVELGADSIVALGPQTYLLTYDLRQGDRLTRRATVWRRTADDWEVVYHQGTLVS